MSVDITGGMIIGQFGDEINIDGFDHIDDWAEEHGVEDFSQHYDADIDHRIFGFEIDDITVSKIDGDWLKGIQEKARKFEEISGTAAVLYGSQNVF